MISDPFPGRLEYDGAIWTGEYELSGVHCLITIDAPESGPTTKQLESSKRILLDLPRICDVARRYIESECVDGVEVSCLSVYSLNIGQEEDEREPCFVLEMSDADKIVIHRVSFEAGVPVDYAWDD